MVEPVKYMITRSIKGFSLFKKGSKRAIIRDGSKNAALYHGKQLAEKHKGILTVHNSSGKVAERFTYTETPLPPPNGRMDILGWMND